MSISSLIKNCKSINVKYNHFPIRISAATKSKPAIYFIYIYTDFKRVFVPCQEGVDFLENISLVFLFSSTGARSYTVS